MNITTWCCVQCWVLFTSSIDTLWTWVVPTKAIKHLRGRSWPSNSVPAKAVMKDQWSPSPICSMYGGISKPTHLLYLYAKGRQIFQSHGASAREHALFSTPKLVEHQMVRGSFRPVNWPASHALHKHSSCETLLQGLRREVLWQKTWKTASLERNHETDLSIDYPRKLRWNLKFNFGPLEKEKNIYTP